MKPIQAHVMAVASIVFIFQSSSFGADQVTLQLQSSGDRASLHWRSQLSLPVSGMYPEYSVLQSTNLRDWIVVGDPIKGGAGVSDESLGAAVPQSGEAAFYRLEARIKMASAEARLGDAIYGYGTEFNRQLGLLGQLPLEQFVTLYAPTNVYLPQVSFDPTTAEFWADFNLDPAVHNATNAEPRYVDFRLNTNELAIFRTNGFVVSQRLGTYSFGDAFYRIYTDDLPVFFSADAALHAWHKSYVAMLEELEETTLAPFLNEMLYRMAGRVPSLWSQSVGTPLTNGVLDADYFLAVARSLSSGTTNVGSLGQGTHIRETLAAIGRLQAEDIVIFGTNRIVDFSQFQVRGHYETSPTLQHYFRTMMWCSLIDFRFSGFEFTFPAPEENSMRELSGAVAMQLLLKESGQFDLWKIIDRTIGYFVGPGDSLNFAQLGDLLAAAGISSAADLPNTAALSNLQSRIMSGQVGVQQIQSGYFFSPLSRQQIKLPRSFTVMGQRFVPDSWAMGQCVFDKIIWDTNGIPEFEDKVQRRVPSALDVAFAVLGNDQTVPTIAARIANTNGHPWRDGRPYQHNLAAARRVIDLQEDCAWTNTIYGCWLACLRELSAPTTGPEFPEAMRTGPWAMKTLNTQLASWTELRHDTVLYAKQSYTGGILCSYPDGYVEPRPAFWQHMNEMALRTKALVNSLPVGYSIEFEASPGDTNFTMTMDEIAGRRSDFLDQFAQTMTTLQQISEKELARAPFTTNEVAFIKGMMESASTFYDSVKHYSGWYPALYYLNARGGRTRQLAAFSPCDEWDGLVTDVHTDVPAPIVGDPGSILHEGVGTVDLLMMAVDCGPGDIAVYAGPVMSHYEFELGPTTRETDTQWKSDLGNGIKPPSPEWTRSYLVP